MTTRFERYSQGYAVLFETMVVRDQWKAIVSNKARQIIENKGRYLTVEGQTGVPWWMIGLIHKMEANLSFEKHLHNGDSLKERTRQVPRGRPKAGKPPFTWEESAVDALRYDGLDKASRWTIERICYYCEKFNGFGYRGKGVNSPYLWSGSTHYRKGKYYADRKYDPNMVSQQAGTMLVLRAMMDADPTIKIAYENQPDDYHVELNEDEVPAKTDGAAESVGQSWTVTGALTAAVGSVVYFFNNIVELVVAGAMQATSLGKVALAFGSFMDAKTVGIIVLAAGIIMVVQRRVNAARGGKEA